MAAASAPPRARAASFIAPAPLIVVFVGIVAAAAVAALGLAELKQSHQGQLGLRAEVVSQALAARLAAVPVAQRPALVAPATRVNDAWIWLQDASGHAIEGRSPLTLQQGRNLPQGAARVVLVDGVAHAVAAATVDATTTVGVALPVPASPPAAQSLVASVTALVVFLVGMAALVALAVVRDVRADVEFLRRRVSDMSRAGSGPTGEPIVVRSVDQVGALTSAFNALVDRFVAADRSYRDDLQFALDSDRQRAAFLAALSHELRTPLNAILGFTDVLLAEVDGPLSEDAKENLLVVRNSGHHLRALIDDILDLSALESGELELTPREVDIYPIAQEVVRELQITAKAKGVRLALDGEPATAWADPKRVRQILSNVLSNAIKFTNEGSVSLDVLAEPAWARLTVTDTGPGIATEHQSAIFDEYTQVGDKRTRGFGTGLGLAITRRLVQMHHGSIELESSVGVGSSFAIFLPRRPLDEDEEPAA
ncbi:MAG: HAMP domain-containing sensor histidine kinase [Polyangiaceae bacterium]